MCARETRLDKRRAPLGLPPIDPFVFCDRRQRIVLRFQPRLYRATGCLETKGASLSGQWHSSKVRKCVDPLNSRGDSWSPDLFRVATRMESEERQ